MKVTLHSTTKVVQLDVSDSDGDFGSMPARMWEGTTERGMPVMAFITRITPARTIDQLTDGDLEEFNADLAEQAPPTAVADMFPARMLID